MDRVHALAGIAALFAGVWLASGAAFPASPEKGRESYIKYGCWQCHGTQGQGAVTGPTLAPNPKPEDVFTGFVRTTSRTMPPYREAVLSNEDLADIYAYLKSIPQGPDAKSISLLNQ
jgi:mono/diheme cytochrome c family protein